MQQTHYIARAGVTPDDMSESQLAVVINGI